MKGYIVFICCSVLLAGACKKFETKNVTNIPDCTYCHLADSIEGSYTGRLVERVWDGPSYDTILDTIITVYVNRTFSGLNNYEDSVVFKYDCSYFHDEIFLSEESIQLGNFSPYGDNKAQKFTDDNRMLVSRISKVQLGAAYFEEYTSLEFEGFKDE